MYHRPSKETWWVSAVSPDGKELIPGGWPETIAKVSDCELMVAAPDEEHEAALDRVLQYRGPDGGMRQAWARLNKQSGGKP